MKTLEYNILTNSNEYNYYKNSKDINFNVEHMHGIYACGILICVGY